MSYSGPLIDLMGDLANRLNKEKNNKIWEQIRYIIIAEGKFDANDWLLVESPLEIKRIDDDRYSLYQHLKFEPSLKDEKGSLRDTGIVEARLNQIVAETIAESLDNNKINKNTLQIAEEMTEKIIGFNLGYEALVTFLNGVTRDLITKMGYKLTPEEIS